MQETFRTTFGDDMSSLTSDSVNISSDTDVWDVSTSFESTPNDPLRACKRSQKRNEKKKCSKSVSYAQLFYDPEENTLVTLMEVNLQDHNFVFGSDEATDNKCGSKQTSEHSMVARGHETAQEYLAIADESRFQDQTLLTECSSNSSDNGREGPELGLPKTESIGWSFSNEPIVFSHHDSKQLWMEENDLNLYLLHDSADPWEAGICKTSLGCTETLRRILMLKSCVSLASIRHVGETKRWKGGCGEKLTETMTYSALEDV